MNNDPCPLCGDTLKEGYVTNSEGEVLCCFDCMEDMIWQDIVTMFDGTIVE